MANIGGILMKKNNNNVVTVLIGIVLVLYITMVRSIVMAYYLVKNWKDFFGPFARHAKR
jgi:hypothetical protein